MGSLLCYQAFKHLLLHVKFILRCVYRVCIKNPMYP
nr:MAG TPA: protein of unknown function (DUF5433) [Caudoviricetes sp.]